MKAITWHVECPHCGMSYNDANSDRPVVCGACGLRLEDISLYQATMSPAGMQLLAEHCDREYAKFLAEEAKKKG